MRAPHLLVELGQLPANGHGPVGAARRHRSSRVRCSRCGDSNMTTARSASPATAARRSRALAPRTGHEPLETPSLGRQPRDHQGRQRRRRPGHGFNGDPFGQGRPHQARPRVADEGGPGVGHEGDGRPGLCPGDGAGVVAASLRRWCETRRGPDMAAWLNSFRARRVSSQ